MKIIMLLAYSFVCALTIHLFQERHRVANEYVKEVVDRKVLAVSGNEYVLSGKKIPSDAEGEKTFVYFNRLGERHLVDVYPN